MPRVSFVDLLLSQLSMMTYIPDKLTPVKMRIKNQDNGSRNIVCKRIAIEAREASAAKTRMCPTRLRKIGIRITG